MANTYDIGDEIELRADFVDANGDPGNPDTVTCRVEKPDGTVVAPSVANPATGVFLANVTPATGESGEWWYSFKGVGTINQRHEAMLYVRPEEVPHP